MMAEMTAFAVTAIGRRDPGMLAVMLLWLTQVTNFCGPFSTGMPISGQRLCTVCREPRMNAATGIDPRGRAIS